MSKVDTGNAKHYAWGGTSDGWHLLEGDDLSVIEERVPPGASETRHRHHRACALWPRGPAAFCVRNVDLAWRPTQEGSGSGAGRSPLCRDVPRLYGAQLWARVGDASSKEPFGTTESVRAPSA